MPATAILGYQRGDEAKGSLVDMFAADYDIGARINGGMNAGHTIILPNGETFKLHGIPSTILSEHAKSVIGNGTLINLIKLVEEIEGLEGRGIEVSPNRLLISSATHLALPHHISADEIREAGSDRQGTTKSGIAQGYAAKALREGIRAEVINNNPDILFEAVKNGLLKQRELRAGAGLEMIDEEDTAKLYVDSALRLGAFITDTVLFLNTELRKSRPARLLAEGAQGFMLDLDHGMYPNTSSSPTTIGGVVLGLGIAPGFIDRVIGVTKAVQSQVGDAPFVTEVTDSDLLEELHGDMSAVDAESGTTTGRKRDLGYLDLPQIRRAIMVNSDNVENSSVKHELALTKLDWVSRFGDDLRVCVAYERKNKTLPVAPDAAYKLEQCTPVYETLPNWTEDIQDVREFEDLPENAQKYVEFVEDQLGVPIPTVGVGPRRDQVIVR